MKTIDELLMEACGRVTEIRVADRDMPADHGKFGSLCRRTDTAYDRLSFALRDYLMTTTEILYDLKRVAERDGKSDLTKCVGCGAVMNELIVLDENPFCPPCVARVHLSIGVRSTPNNVVTTSGIAFSIGSTRAARVDVDRQLIIARKEIVEESGK